MTIIVPAWAVVLLIGCLVAFVWACFVVICYERRPKNFGSGQYSALPAQVPEQVTREHKTGRWTAAEAPTVQIHSCVDALEPAAHCHTCHRPWPRPYQRGVS